MDDRGKVIEGLKELCEYLFHEYKTCYHGDEEDTYNRFLAANNALELLKEQEAEPGHWIVLENQPNAGVYCSECNTKIFDHYPMKKKYSYFCPHCGTRMEGQAVRLECPMRTPSNGLAT